MKAVFADALYWIALARPRDAWKAAARKARAELGAVHIVTTEEVLVEFLTTLSARPELRAIAVRVIQRIVADPGATIVPQSHTSFVDGLSLYEQRLDKEYSMTDCISMTTMRTQGISEVLTNDHHFTQEGFTVLIQQADDPV